jgi:hypothetical protein
MFLGALARRLGRQPGPSLFSASESSHIRGAGPQLRGLPERRGILAVTRALRRIHALSHHRRHLHWRLLTNHPVVTGRDLDATLDGYAHRWKIEELHRVWKSGACRVEQSQLRTAERVIKWAILAVVNAARIERLRMLARTQPDLAADTEFTAYELRALTLMKRKYAKRTETIPDDIPSMTDAVRWLAELGGYAGRPSSGLPGAVTIRRGLEFITPVAIALELLRNEGKL